MSTSDWIAGYAAVISTILALKELINWGLGYLREHKQRPQLRFELGLGPVDMNHVTSYEKVGDSTSITMRQERPLVLMITNEGGVPCIITKVIADGRQSTSENLPMVIEPAKRGWCEIGFPDDFNAAIEIEAKQNTGKRCKVTISMPGMLIALKPD